eukprot:TRINITY_DN1481_c0_g1_i1.p1 TRINITY_DN1481_c0_g1~~TRINITY_DN1481_c0_g1_i1.p1  ORF type:complete len:325 (+),score=108.25 TRINITY_DN1481_c0_g1_i1:67-1041(+)
MADDETKKEEKTEEKVEEKKEETGDAAVEDAKTKKPRSKRKRRDADGDDDGEPRVKKHKEIDIDCITSNAKTELYSYVQIKLGRTLKRDEIVFKNEKLDSMFVSTVEIAAMDGLTFTGEAKETAKKAEVAACFTALQEQREDILALNADAKPLPRNEDGEIKADAVRGGNGEASEGGEKRQRTNKELLQHWSCKAGTRAVKAGDVEYTCEEVEGGYKATVKLLHLPEPHCDKVFTGEVCEGEREAENHAAGIALEVLTNLIETEGKANWAEKKVAGLQPKKTGEPAATKGKGKGKGFGKADMMTLMAMNMMAAWGGGRGGWNGW